jgi:type I restriction enzyme, S subunit
MMWTTRRLDECVQFLSGGTPNKGKLEYWGGDIPWVSSAEMTERFLSNTSLNISAEGLAAGSRLVPEGSTFVVVRGMSLAKEFRISLAQRAMAFNQDVKALIPKSGVDGRFIFYSLCAHASSIRDLATEAAHGTKKLEMSRLESYVIEVPNDVETQQVVASVAYAYDDLIATNRRRMALLEDAARRLYREWFVHLRFPGHESVVVKDGVPEGWRKQSLASVADVNARSIGARDRPDSVLYIDISTVSTGLIGEVTPYAFADAPGRARRRVVHGDVIWSCVRPNRRSYALIWEPDERLVASTGFAVLSATGVPFSYLYFTTTTDTFVGHLEQNSTGAAYPAVTAKTFEDVEILVPDGDTLAAFDHSVLPQLEQTEFLKQQNRALAQARDLLLPKLMSGQLDVSGIRLPEEATA